MFRFATGLCLLGLCFVVSTATHAQDSKPPALTPEEEKLAAEATRLNGEGVQLYQQGQRVAAVEKMRQALELRGKIYPPSNYPDGHPDLAISLSNMGDVLWSMGQAEKAIDFYQQSLEITKKLFPAAKYPDGHTDLATCLNNMGFVLHSMGQTKRALTFYQQSLDMRQKLFPVASYPDGHPHLATSLNNMGAVLRSLGQPDKALDFYQQSFDMTKKFFPAARYPDGHPELVTSLNSMGGVLKSLGQAEKALSFFQQSFDMTKKLFPVTKFPDGHPELAKSLNNMGSVLESMGQAEKALDFHQQSLEMYQKLFPAARYPYGHPHLATSLHNMGGVLLSTGQAEKGLNYYQQSLDMYQKLFPVASYPDGHPDLATSLNSMGLVLHSMGQTERALTFYQQSLAMRQKLFPAARYPDGHPHLATSFNNMGAVLRSLGQAERALNFHQQSLDMTKKLFPAAKYPDGHPELALGLNNMGFVLQSVGQAEKGLSFYQQSLDMNKKLFPAARYPDGHPKLALSLNNMAALLLSLARAAEALDFCQQSLDMRQKLFPFARYPDGHPDLAISLSSMGCVLQSLGHTQKPFNFHQQSLQMQQRLLRRELATASEEAAFDKVDTEPLFRDSYISISRNARTSPDEVVTQLWPSRSAVTRLLEQRQANARAAGTELGAKLVELRGLRRRVDRLLQDANMKPEVRDKLLVEVANKRDVLEREVVARMPTLQRWEILDKLGPVDLVKALPPGAVFIDVIRYTHFDYVEKKQKRTQRYIAFVVAKSPVADASGSPTIQRVELESAKEIDAAVAQWRSAIESRESSPAAETLSRLIWEPLSKAIPPGTTTLYLALDGDLARMPWAALPVGDGQVLLEKYAIAAVPHGVFLLDQLRNSPHLRGRLAEESVLTLGGVEYGSGKWPALPGTLREVEALAKVAPGTVTELTKGEATLAKLQASLANARYVHLATHGQFQADAFADEKKRAAQAIESRMLGNESRQVAAKNPLGYVGIVLANGDVLSGLGIVDLPLQQTQLVTLSACETGLGELTGGEGVQGLQRAFHLAGCPNVVASLWQVNDDATAALMKRFYYHLWQKKEEPIQALRLAQLELYRNPTQVADLLRGNAPKFSGATKPLPKEAAPKDGERAATKLWAAFVLSGVGK